MKFKMRLTPKSRELADRIGKIPVRKIADTASELTAREGLEWLLEYIRTGPLPPRKGRRRGNDNRLKLRNAGVIHTKRGGPLDDTGAYLRSLRAARFGSGVWGIVGKMPLHYYLEYGTSRMAARPHFGPMMRVMSKRAPEVFGGMIMAALHGSVSEAQEVFKMSGVTKSDMGKD